LFSLLSFVYKYVDEEFIRQGWGIQLNEDANLNVPFYLPDDGYSWETLRGIPKQLLDFIEPINQLELCRLFTNAYSVGLWTQFMQISKVNNRRSFF
jgi:afadin